MTPAGRLRALQTVGAMSAGSIVIAVGLIAKWEGKSNAVYLDTGGVPTVCFGHTGPDVKMGQAPRSDAECRRLLYDVDLPAHAEGLAACLTRATPDALMGSFVSWTFNVGVRAACSSTAVRKANAGDFIGACLELLRWNKDNGRVVRGLVNRRTDESAVCRSGIVK